jgi:hypothetical protein
MVIMNGVVVRILASLLGIGALSACSLDCKFDKNDLDVAATLSHSAGGYNPLPHDAWTTNPRLETFLRDALKTNGVGVLSAKYGLQCTPSPGEARCNDCFTCRKTVKEWRLGMVQPPIPIYMEIFKCVDWGEVLVQADFGPSPVVKAMTYWKTTPEARDVLSRPRVRPSSEVPALPPPR